MGPWKYKAKIQMNWQNLISVFAPTERMHGMQLGSPQTEAKMMMITQCDTWERRNPREWNTVNWRET